MEEMCVNNDKESIGGDNVIKRRMDGVKYSRDGKMILYYNTELFNREFNYVSSRGYDYKLYVSGNTRMLELSNKKVYCVGSKFIAGSHLGRFVKEDILSMSFDLQKRGNDYKEQYFNLDLIESLIGFQVCSVDINDCYWKTAYNMGIISRKTYLKGRQNPKGWKLGRVSSIGGLDKKTIISHFEKGEFKKRDVVLQDERFQNARHNIIGSVYDMFKRLDVEIGGNSLMFLTDCIVVESKYLRQVKKFFKDFGYDFKVKNITFEKVDRVKKEIFWICDEENFENEKKLIELEKLKAESEESGVYFKKKYSDELNDLKNKKGYKYYQYSNRQLSW